MNKERQSELTEYLNYVTKDIFKHTRPNKRCSYRQLSNHDKFVVKLSLLPRRTAGELDSSIHKELLTHCKNLQ